MLKLFRSLKLTLLLLLALALLAIGGTVIPVEAQRYEPYYQSLWYRLLLGLLALNILCCTLSSLPRKLRYRLQLSERLQQQSGGGTPLALPLSVLAERLNGSGYRLQASEDRLIATRGAGRRFSSTLVHLAVLLVMLGGVLGETGFVGTINTYLQQPTGRFFDWEIEAERLLGFSLRADAFRVRYYPIQLRFELLDTVTGENFGKQLHYDQDSFVLPGSELRGQLRGFDPERKLLTIDVYQRQQLLGQYLISDQAEQFGSARHPRFRLLKLEYRDPVVKQFETDVTLLENGRTVKQGTIRVNEPLSYRGVSIYQTAYGMDEFGNRTVGFQLSKDPGEWLVWLAVLPLMAGLLMLFLPQRSFGIKLVDGQPQLFCFSGFSGAAGELQRQQLLEKLSA